jgi:Flp pilus assembly pilin Flp
MSRFRRLARDRRGATTVEYMILVGVALVVMGAFGDFGGAVQTRMRVTAAPSFKPMSLLGF